MNLPDILQEAIENEAKQLKSNTLVSATKELSQRYRDEKQRGEVVSKKQFFIGSSAQRTAYILSRMPATFQAVTQALNETHERLNQSFNSVLDIGAGPGTVMWACYELFPYLENMTLLEQDPALISLGKKLTSKSNTKLLRDAKWLQGDVLKQASFPVSDLIVVSYSMGEWPEESRQLVLEKLWQAAKKALVIIEPGTMAGFDVIRKARTKLIELNACMVAPCPHHLACPMPANDWCHFSTRIERSRLHKQAKAGSLSYEDEKFSYIAVSKTAVELPEARILRHPLKRSGHVSFTLCTKDEGLIKKTISRKEGDLYKEARDLDWGDTF